jgi:hypothetical protein
MGPYRESQLRRVLCAMTLTTVLGLCVVNQPALATIIGYTFDANLQTGPLAGTSFSGLLSYDDAGATGVGQEFLELASLDFTLLGVSFTRADIKQGGQAILEDGVLSYFTAAFFPPPPDNSPVSDIAFGFGGPGVIGYTTPPGFTNFGSGQYTLHPSAIPAPSTLACVALGLGALAAAASCKKLGAFARPLKRAG